MEEPEDLCKENQGQQISIEEELLDQISIEEGKEAGRKKKGSAGSQEKRQSSSSAVVQHISDEEEVDLSAIMKSLQIAIPKDIEVEYQGEEMHKPEENSPFKLLMKVASSTGTPRNIPLKALNNAMSSAWGGRYWFIDQIKPALYKAYFKSEEDMDFVLKRQPWSVENDNLLLEWINPNEEDRDIEDYQFRYIYVPIRVYGVPEKFRTPSLMKYVIDNSAQLSDMHPPPEITMTSRKDYIQAYAKMDILKPVKDKVKYFVSPKDYILFYLNYEKIKRICIFCGMMFHSVQNCPNRSKLIRHLQSIRANTSIVPFSNIGIWTSQAMKIPQEALQQSSIVGREMRKECLLNIDQLSFSKLNIPEKQSNPSKENWKHSDKLVHPTLQQNTQIGTNMMLKLPPQYSEIDTSKQQRPDINIPQQGRKRQAESEVSPMEEDTGKYCYTRPKYIHQEQLLCHEANNLSGRNIDQSKVNCPPQLRLQHEVEARDKTQTPLQTIEQFQHNTMVFNEGISQSSGTERKKIRPQKRVRSDERKQQIRENKMKASQEGNQQWKIQCPNQANLFTVTLNETGQVYNCGTSCMREDKEISKEENQAAAPASKAPRAQ